MRCHILMPMAPERPTHAISARGVRLSLACMELRSEIGTVDTRWLARWPCFCLSSRHSP